MLRRVALVRTDISEERIASIMRVTGVRELETTLAVTSKGSTLRLGLQAEAITLYVYAAVIVLMPFNFHFVIELSICGQSLLAMGNTISCLPHHLWHAHVSQCAEHLHSHRRENLKSYIFSLFVVMRYVDLRRLQVRDYNRVIASRNRGKPTACVTLLQVHEYKQSNVHWILRKSKLLTSLQILLK
jgi:hypothetical protein